MLVGEAAGRPGGLAGSAVRGACRGSCSTGRSTRPGSTATSTYVTNAVKHFKWKARGPRRIHDKPTWTEQVACRPWLEAELALVRPRALVLLGATAAQSLLGKGFKVTQERGEAARLRPR